MQTDIIVQINREMSPFQRQKLETTPFKWLLCLEEPLQISNVVVMKLVSRWSSIDLCFQIREYLVSFFVFEVCLYLGLGVVGEEVNFEHCAPGMINK